MARWVAVTVVVAALAVSVGSWWLLVGGPRAHERDATEAAEAFLRAWSNEDWAALAARVTPPGQQARDMHERMAADLDLVEGRYELRTLDVGAQAALARFRAHVLPAGLGTWSYDNELELERVGGVWSVRWTPRVLHPEMVEQSRFELSRTWPERAAILGADGDPLVGQAQVVSVGVEPRRITDADALARALSEVAGADEASVRALLERDDLRDDWFYPVVEVRHDVFERIEEDLRSVPGVVFRRSEGERAAPTSSFAQPLLGRVSELDETLAEDFGQPYQEGDTAGLFGLERAFEERLAGRPRLRIAVVDESGDELSVVHEVEGADPEPVRLTIDRRTQEAAEQALEGIDEHAALVAVDATTGGLRAVANRPHTGFNRALAGRYPPGSTFKIVTTAAILDAGLGPGDTLECPAQLSVGGRAFRNVDDQAMGTITLREAFARSCNTAFVGAAASLDGALGAAAERFGFGTSPDLPVEAARAEFPEPQDVVELAAAAIGQGRVQASPAHMASVAAAARAGVWRPLRLLDEQEIATGQPIPGDPGVLAELMREVVRSGTGQAATVEGSAVAGKTGTAEFGTADPPETHAWFVGFHEDLAFAVLIEEGGRGGAVAAPVAARFVRALN